MPLYNVEIEIQNRFDVEILVVGNSVTSGGAVTVNYSPNPTSGAASETLESGDTIIPVTVQKGLKDSGGVDIVAETSVLKKLGESEDARQVAPDGQVDTQLKDSAGDVIGAVVSKVVKSNDLESQDITAPDGLVDFRLKDTDGNTLISSSVNVKSNGSEATIIIAPDSTINIQKQDSTPSDIGAVIPVTAKSNETKAVNVPVADATVNIQRKDTEGTNIGAVIPVSVKAEATVSQDVESPNVIINDSGGTPVGFLDNLGAYTTTLLSGKTYTMSYADRNVPTDGILVFDRLRIQSPEFVTSANKSFTLSGTSVLGSEWIMLIDNSAGYDVTFSVDFDVFGVAPTGRFTIYMTYHNSSGKVLAYMDTSGGVAPPPSVILVEDNFSITPLAANADRVIANPNSVLSIVGSQLQISTSSVFAARTNYVSYSAFVSTGTKSVMSSEFYGAYDTTHQPQTVLYTDSSNRAQISLTTGNVYRLVIVVGGSTIYDLTTAIDVATYPRHKIVLDHSSGDLEFYYYNAGWVQMGVTQVGTALPTTSYGMLTIVTSSAAAAVIQMDNFSFCDDDYTTQFPV